VVVRGHPGGGRALFLAGTIRRTPLDPSLSFRLQADRRASNAGARPAPR
jgi:hypothetical protein